MSTNKQAEEYCRRVSTLKKRLKSMGENESFDDLYELTKEQMDRIKNILEALSTDGFPCPQEMAIEAAKMLSLFKD